jgi:hypothetical protein
MMKLAEKVKGVLCTVKNRVYYPVAVGAMSVGMSLTALAAEGDAVSTTNVAENLATSFQTMANTMIDTIFAVLPVVLSVMSAYLCIKFGINFFQKMAGSATK